MSSNMSDQSNIIKNNLISNMVKTIKAMQSTIRPEQYNQSNMVSNTIKINLKVVTLLVAPI